MVFNYSKNKWSKLKDRNLDGIIYTENIKPDKIKYLKTKRSYLKHKYFYVLFGNASNNKIECKVPAVCKSYGHTGKDEFFISPDTKGKIYIQDLKQNGGDYIKLQRYGLWPINEKDLYINNDYIVIPLVYVNSKNGTKKYVYIKGVELGEVKKWIEIANIPNNGTYIDLETGEKFVGKDLINKKDKNPIQIE